MYDKNFGKHAAIMQEKNNRYFVLGAISQNQGMLEHYGWTNEKLSVKPDGLAILMAVHHYGYALKFAGELNRSEKDIVLVAVIQDGLALKFASRDLQNDPGIVKEAVTQNGNALKYASNQLKKDPKIVSLAISQTKTAKRYSLSKEL